jgi:endonuclease YncB( thermonuclease family)
MAARPFPVEAGHVLAFARALGAVDPPGGLPGAGDAAPPTFAIASAQFNPEYPAQVWPGDTLTVRGSVVRIYGGDDGPVAELAVSTVALSAADGEGREVVSGYAHARLAA